MQEASSFVALNADCRTLPKLQEHPPGALSGAGQKGIGSVATGHATKYCSTKSWYWHEYTWMKIPEPGSVKTVTTSFR